LHFVNLYFIENIEISGAKNVNLLFLLWIRGYAVVLISP